MAFDPVAYITEPRWRQSRLGLDRMVELMDRLGNPQAALRFVHVAGTNGKGSTCVFTASILQAAGYRTGLFTSPAIMDFTDRIRVDGRIISLDELRDVTLEIREQADAMEDHPTEFELMTAVAFVYFARQGCDICVVEVGMGGRLDSTNIIERSDVCAIAPIALDHMAFLGDTIAAIAREKAGIIKPGAMVVSAAQERQADTVIRQVAGENNARLQFVRQSDVLGTSDDFSYYLEPTWGHFQLGMLGSYQPQNAALSLEVIHALRERGWDIPDTAIRKGLASARWPGRFEVVGEAPTFIIDGGHNPQGARALVDSLAQRYPGRTVFFVMGVLADKDYRTMLDILIGYRQTRAIFTVTPPNERALSSSDLAAAVQERVEAANRAERSAHPLMPELYAVHVVDAGSIEAGVGKALDIAWDLMDDDLISGPSADPFDSLTGWSKAPSYANPVIVACGSLYSVAAVERAYQAATAQGDGFVCEPGADSK
ncbi:MAG: bifunctional folylpolyglutamate synthase/dihydrofolate synthase [Eggerthellaceae bacterium]|jgi:dihydrofolate synthase/folylpolyglutamate synthase